MLEHRSTVGAMLVLNFECPCGLTRPSRKGMHVGPVWSRERLWNTCWSRLVQRETLFTPSRLPPCRRRENGHPIAVSTPPVKVVRSS